MAGPGDSKWHGLQSCGENYAPLSDWSITPEAVEPTTGFSPLSEEEWRWERHAVSIAVATRTSTGELKLCNTSDITSTNVANNAARSLTLNSSALSAFVSLEITAAL